jgi:hypothetical protein
LYYYGLPGPPVAVLIGFRIVEVEIGRAVMDLNASRRHANPMGAAREAADAAARIHRVRSAR